jgi:membrane protease YdiL (CAAX protease family)
MNEHTDPAGNPFAAPTAIEAELVPERGGFFLDSTQRLRTVWRFLIFIAGFIGAQIAAAVVVFAGLMIFLIATRGRVSEEEILAIIENPDAGLFALSVIPQLVAALAVVVFCRLVLDRRSLWSMGLVKPSQEWRRSWLLGFLFGAGPIALCFAIIAALGGYRLGDVSFTVGAAVLTPALVLAAFHEEIVFRGYLLQNMLDIRRPIAGVLISSLLFWLVHAFNPSAWISPLVGLNLFMAGILLSLAYMLARDIWFPTIMHFAWNFTQGIVLDIPISGIDSPGIVEVNRSNKVPDWITGGEFGLEASAVTAVVQACVALLLLALIKRSSGAACDRQPPTSNQQLPTAVGL